MEQKIGETFDFYGVKIEVAEATQRCIGCYFHRKDRKPVIFQKYGI